MERSVRIVESCSVVPATYQPEGIPKRIDLTPWDLQFLLRGPMQFGLLYNASTPNLIHSLKDSLSRTLDFFYPLAGRLASIKDGSSESTLFYVQCNNAGVEFAHAVAEDINVADIVQPVYDSSIIYQLFLENDLMNIECDSKPFLAVQVTELADGGCFIGCSLSHLFADGSSFWHFVNSWSDICRGSESLKNPPVLDRCYPNRSQIWIPNRLLATQGTHSKNSNTFKERICNLPKEKIISLKQKAINETGNVKISSLQAILAYIWRAVSINRHVQDDDDIFLTMVVDDRTRTEPPLSSHYLGNASRLAITSLKGKETLAEDGLGRAASQLNKTVAAQTNSAARDFIRSWIVNPKLIPPGIIAMKNSLGISNSPRFDVYGNDFGWGRPLTVRNGVGNLLGEKVTLFAGAEEGSFDLDLCLCVDTLEGLEKEEEFVHYEVSYLKTN
ncbi:hypothetical protein QQ045_015734 [Rhodiola kirilowii]